MKIAKIVIFKVDYLNVIEIYRGVSKFLRVHTKYTRPLTKSKWKSFKTFQRLDNLRFRIQTVSN